MEKISHRRGKIFAKHTHAYSHVHVSMQTHMQIKKKRKKEKAENFHFLPGRDPTSPFTFSSAARLASLMFLEPPPNPHPDSLPPLGLCCGCSRCLECPCPPGSHLANILPLVRPLSPFSLRPTLSLLFHSAAVLSSRLLVPSPCFFVP